MARIEINETDVDKDMEGEEQMEIPENDSANEDSSDSDDEKEERELERSVVELGKRLATNPYDYDAHVELVSAKRKLTDLMGLRSAYQKFSELFPLTSELWLDWIRDEMKLVNSAKEREFVNGLFERAVVDYLSIPLWLEYVQFSMGSNDLEQTRSVFERALNSAGLHVSQSILLWDAYREFELACLSLITDASSDEWLTQAQRVATVYKRELSVPLNDMDHTFVEFRVWLEKLPRKDILSFEEVERLYNSASEHLKRIYDIELETCNAKDDASKLSCYERYIKLEEGSPHRVCALYERAVSDVPLSGDLWYRYCSYTVKLGSPDVALSVCKRAVRNCSWSAELWVFYMRAIELFDKTHKEITDCFENALLACNSSAESLLSVWLGYIEYCRRKVFNDHDEEQMQDKTVDKLDGQFLRQIFSRACEHLAESWGLQGDPKCILLQFWARVEASLFKDMEAARKLWTDILSQGHHSMAAMWLELISLELRYGDAKHIRKTFQRAINSTKDWPYSIAEAWLNYERDYGTLETLMACLDRCRNVVQSWNATQTVQENKTEQNTGAKKKRNVEKQKVKNVGFKILDNGSQKGVERVKRKSESDTENEPLKKVKHYEADLQAISELSMDTSESEQDKLSMKSDKRLNDNLHKQIVTMDPEKESRTVFVSNLDYSVDENKLKDWFGDCKELRLVKDYKGRSKGYCYVEFESIEEASKALKRDRDRLDGRPVFISRCKSERVGREHAFKYSTTREQHKLFVKGLSLASTQQEIEELFGKHGKLKDVRMVCYRNGHFKGLAYIEYENAADAAKAIVETDGLIVAGHTINVAISAPPQRKEKDKLGLGDAAPTRATVLRKGRLQVPLIPTVVKKTVIENTSNDSLVSKSKTNEDFRKMLFEKK